MAVYTFLVSYDFSGKTVVPYCTHEGSGLGSGEQDIRQLCPTAKVLSGLAIKGGAVARLDNDLANWLRSFLVNRITTDLQNRQNLPSPGRIFAWIS